MEPTIHENYDSQLSRSALPSTSQGEESTIAILDRVTIDPTGQEITVYTGPDSEPIQVRVLAQFTTGLGDSLVNASLEDLKRQPGYFYVEGEYSASIYATTRQDASAAYRMAVGNEPLTWHRHPRCAHRIITVITGSGGAQASFSLATEQEIGENPKTLVQKMIIVELPPDAQVCIRFNGVTYHQFGPLDPAHLAFAGFSVHKNETDEFAEVRSEQWSGTESLMDESIAGSIPLFTRCIPESVQSVLNQPGVLQEVPRFRLGGLPYQTSVPEKGH